MAAAELFDLALTGGFVGACHALIYLASRHREKERVGAISQLFVYPIKSCPGISVDSCELTEKGVVSGKLIDRSFMFVKPNGGFISQRTHPQLANVRVEEGSTGLILHAPDMDNLDLSFEIEDDAEKVNVRVWDTNTIALDCGKEAAEWAEKFLKLPGARIVQAHPLMTSRPSLVPGLKFHNKKSQDCVNFQDNTPIHILSDKSIEDINSSLSPLTDVRNYRPNIFVTDVSSSYDEDDWIEIFIGKAEMHGMFMNERCKLPTVDLDTGEFRPDRQPYRALETSRKLDGHRFPCFGINAGVDRKGTINVGDEIFAYRGQVP